MAHHLVWYPNGSTISIQFIMMTRPSRGAIRGMNNSAVRTQWYVVILTVFIVVAALLIVVGIVVTFSQTDDSNREETAVAAELTESVPEGTEITEIETAPPPEVNTGGTEISVEMTEEVSVAEVTLETTAAIDVEIVVSRTPIVEMTPEAPVVELTEAVEVEMGVSETPAAEVT